jgi:hypothetical protein
VNLQTIRKTGAFTEGNALRLRKQVPGVKGRFAPDRNGKPDRARASTYAAIGKPFARLFTCDGGGE